MGETQLGMLQRAQNRAMRVILYTKIEHAAGLAVYVCKTEVVLSVYLFIKYLITCYHYC